jgi:hypothetical protein
MMMTMKNWQAEIHHIQQPQPRGIIPLYLELIKENNANISFNFCADVKDFLVTSVLSCHQVGFHDLQALLTQRLTLLFALTSVTWEDHGMTVPGSGGTNIQMLFRHEFGHLSTL